MFIDKRYSRFGKLCFTEVRGLKTRFSVIRWFYIFARIMQCDFIKLYVIIPNIWSVQININQTNSRYYSGCCKIMMASSNGNIFRVTSPLWGESTSHRWIPPHRQRPATRNFAVLFDLRLNKQLSKQSRRRWFDTSSGLLRRHGNVVTKNTTNNTFRPGKNELEMSIICHRNICCPDQLYHKYYIALKLPEMYFK